MYCLRQDSVVNRMFLQERNRGATDEREKSVVAWNSEFGDLVGV